MKQNKSLVTISGNHDIQLPMFLSKNIVFVQTKTLATKGEESSIYPALYTNLVSLVDEEKFFTKNVENLTELECYHFAACIE